LKISPWLSLEFWDFPMTSLDFTPQHFYTAPMMNVPIDTGKQGFQGLTVAAFESRMAKEMEDLILRHGGKPLVAPSMREIPLVENQAIFDFFERLQANQLAMVIFLTGVGTRSLFQVLESRFSKSDILSTLKKVTIAARGSKSVKALQDYGLPPSIVAPEPNTWREVIQILDTQKPILGLRIAVQEYGVSNPDFLDALKERGAIEVLPIPVYRWALPEDTAPLVRLIESILEGKVQVALFTSANQVQNVLDVAKGLGKEKHLFEAFSKIVVCSIGSIASEALQSRGLGIDLIPEHPKMGFLVKEAAEKSVGLLEEKKKISPLSPVKKTDLQESLFLKACRREPTSRTPLWIMRQAGRYLPEYREIRSKVSFLELCKTPELACQATVSAQEVLGVDAAILFADILLISEPLGFHLEFAQSGGPIIHDPFRSAEDLKRLKHSVITKGLGYVLEAVRLIRSRLNPAIPLIGFAGAPFTLASYLIEGGGSKEYSHLKNVLAGDPSTWNGLMGRLVNATQDYLNAQIEAGAQAVQLFDSWVGILTPEEFQKFALPFLKTLIAGIKPGIPVIYFGTQTEPFYPYLKNCGAHVIGVDWRVDLDKAREQLGDLAVQGNLDPNVLLTDPPRVREKTLEVLKKAKGRPGYIFNLGHGILPQTPMENVRVMIDTVKNWKA